MWDGAIISSPVKPSMENLGEMEELNAPGWSPAVPD
jgi:hypothetical protein